MLEAYGTVGGVHALAAGSAATKHRHFALGEESVVGFGYRNAFLHCTTMLLLSMCDTDGMSDQTRYGFSCSAWEHARAEADEILRRCARERRTITYGELCRSIASIELKPRSWAMMAFLGEACDAADREHGVVLATLVVRSDTGRPGEGYFRHAAGRGEDVSDREAYWCSCAERVFRAFEGE